ncbi:14405_t:CDS:2 [Racocetra fulgida]|uniref:14405_t:CDS:1 n=1 Tax=Racocetra fulgida TaxID=60492 RepID=A0A9N9AJE5_9GLOM|nr:14405_t:CDS:2 [Racocetra fulgida]
MRYYLVYIIYLDDFVNNNEPNQESTVNDEKTRLVLDQINVCPSPNTSSNTCTRTQKKRLLQCSSLLNIYLSFLPKEEKLTLTNNKIKLQQWNTGFTFNYVEFLRYLDLEELFITVRSWKQCLSKSQLISNNDVNSQKLKRFSSKKSLVNSIKSLKNVILRKKHSTFSVSKAVFPVSVDRVVSYSLAKLIMNNSKKLILLSIDPTIGDSIKNYRCNCMDPIFNIDNYGHQIFKQNVPEEHLLIATYPGANECLSSLTEFICTTRGTKWRLFHAMSSICKQLKMISVDMGGYDSWSNAGLQTYTEPQMQELEWEAKNLATLIRSQSSLKEFLLSRGEIGLNTILDALTSQVISLKYIEFINIDTKLSLWGSLERLNEFNGLKTLKFISCRLNDILTKPLVSNPIPLFRLTTIEMSDSTSSPEIVLKLIKDSGSSLKSLILGDHHNKEGSDSACNIIETTAKYCPNIVNFSSIVSVSEISQLLTLFTFCPQLESVTLRGPEDETDHVIEDINWLFEQMGELQLLRKLRNLAIQAPWSFLPHSLNEFLKDSSPPLRSLEFSCSHCFSDGHLEVILRCLGKNLKRLKLATCIEMDDELIVEALATIEDFEFKTFISSHGSCHFNNIYIHELVY